LIDLSGCDVVVFAEVEVEESFVCAEVEVGFASVVCDVDFAVYVWVHGSCVYVYVGVDFDGCGFVASGLEHFADGCCENAFSD